MTDKSDGENEQEPKTEVKGKLASSSVNLTAASINKDGSESENVAYQHRMDAVDQTNPAEEPVMPIPTVPTGDSVKDYDDSPPLAFDNEVEELASSDEQEDSTTSDSVVRTASPTASSAHENSEGE